MPIPPLSVQSQRCLPWLTAIFLTLLLGLLAPPAQAQTRPGLLSFQRIAVPDDVPAHLSTALVQDKRGFLWIGTQEGLVRFDGYSFRVFRPRSGDPTSLGGSYVRSLHLARDGRLWVGTLSGGLSVLDPKTERFQQYRHDANDAASLANDRVEAIAEDGQGRIWLGTDDGLDSLDPASGRFSHHRHDDSDPYSVAVNQVRGLLFDSHGRLWVGSRGALQRLELDKANNARFTRMASTPGEVGSLDGQQVLRLFEDRRGRLWVGTVGHGVAVLDGERGTLIKRLPPGRDAEGLSHFWIYAFAEAEPGEIWVGTFGGGVDVVDAETLKVVDRLRQDGGPSSIGNDRIGALLSDRSGLLWVGSWGGGLARHDPSTRAFLKLRHRPGADDGPSHPAVVRALETADGRLWLGTNGNGIDVLDANGRRVQAFRPDTANAGALADGSVTCLAQGPDGSVWVATLDGRLHRLRKAASRFERLGPAEGLPGGPIRSMVFGPDGALWVASSSGLARIDPQGRVTAFVHRPDDPRTLPARGVESLVFGRDGTLWVGTENGLAAFDTATGQAQRIRRDSSRSDSLPDNWVPDLMLAGDGKLWLATPAGAAILKSWDGKTARFDHLTPRLKLPARPVESLLQDEQGQVWLGGRIRVDPKTWQWRSFDAADGNEFRTVYLASRERRSNGELMFGSPEGLLLVRPQHLQQRWGYQPGVNLCAIAVDGQALPGVAELGQLVMRPGQQSLRVEFAALDLSAPHKLRYRYKLEGYERDWVEADASQRLAAYTGLPPGEYRLRVQGSNREGAWSPHEGLLSLSVRPAFFQTWWFRLLMGLLALLAIAGVFRLRLRQLRLRGERLERVVDERTAALQKAYRRIEQASLSDPLTQLHNRRFLEQAMPGDFELALRRHSAPGEPATDADLVLLMLDIDHFKQVNDEHGHAAGDAVLVQTAQLLRQCLRASDHVVRWGGEEFLVVARFVDRTSGPALAEKIRAALAAHEFELAGGLRLRRTVSIGFAAFPFAPGVPVAASLDLLQRLADQALYAAKRSWRDAWVGVELQASADGEQVERALHRFLSDAQAAVDAGEVGVTASRGEGLRWR